MGKTFRKERNENKGRRVKCENKPRKDVRSYKGASFEEIKDEDFYDEE